MWAHILWTTRKYLRDTLDLPRGCTYSAQFDRTYWEDGIRRTIAIGMINIFIWPNNRPSSSSAVATPLSTSFSATGTATAGVAVATLSAEDIVEPQLIAGLGGEPPPKFRKVDPGGMGFVPDGVSTVPSTAGVVVAGLLFVAAISG